MEELYLIACDVCKKFCHVDYLAGVVIKDGSKQIICRECLNKKCDGIDGSKALLGTQINSVYIDEASFSEERKEKQDD